MFMVLSVTPQRLCDSSRNEAMPKELKKALRKVESPKLKMSFLRKERFL